MSDQFARMRKHTPGPWRAIGDEIYGADGNRVAEAVRDIELVRSAPELLAERDALYRANIEATAAYDHWLTESKERGQKAEAETERLRAELARLTTLRPASERRSTGLALWHFASGAATVSRKVQIGSIGWTPLPKVKQATQ